MTQSWIPESVLSLSWNWYFSVWYGTQMISLSFCLLIAIDTDDHQISHSQQYLIDRFHSLK